MVWSGLEQYQSRKKEYFWPTSESCLTSIFKWIITNLWINEYQNCNAFYTPYISHRLRIQNNFCCMPCDTRIGLFNFWNVRCRKRSKKGPFAALTIESPNEKILCGFIYLLLKIVYWQSLREDFALMWNTLDHSYRDHHLKVRIALWL